MNLEQDAAYMKQALKMARKAEDCGEVPVGAVVMLNGKIIAKGYNRPISLVDATAHAEIVSLRTAAKQLKNYRLPEVTLYVTLEPCVMCLGAIMHFRIKRLVFGASDPKAGAVIGKFNLLNQGIFEHKMEVTAEVLFQECSDILTNFFKRKRKS